MLNKDSFASRISTYLYSFSMCCRTGLRFCDTERHQPSWSQSRVSHGPPLPFSFLGWQNLLLCCWTVYSANCFLILTSISKRTSRKLRLAGCLPKAHSSDRQDQNSSAGVLTQASDDVLWVTVILLMAMEKGVILKMKLLKKEKRKKTNQPEVPTGASNTV